MSLVRLGSAAARRQIEAIEGAAQAQARSLDPALAVSTETAARTEKGAEQLTQFIPTEMITIFLAAVSAWQSLKPAGEAHWFGAHWLVAVFAILTPLMLVLAGFATFQEEKRARALPADVRFILPRFEMIAATVAFSVWAFAVPGLYPGNEEIQILVAFGALIVSWILSQCRRIVGP